MTNPQDAAHSKVDDHDREPDLGTDEPTTLPWQVWASGITFALFVVITSGCMANYLFR